jgi:hypothetical protein
MWSVRIREVTYLLLLVLLILGSYRAWRLVGRDTITEGLRDRLPERVRTPVECPWCAGLWFSAAIVLIVDIWFVPLPLPLLWIGAVSTGVGLIGSNDG